MSIVGRLAFGSLLRYSHSTVVKVIGLVLCFTWLFAVLMMLSGVFDYFLETRRESSQDVDPTIEGLKNEAVDNLTLPGVIKGSSKVFFSAAFLTENIG